MPNENSRHNVLKDMLNLEGTKEPLSEIEIEIVRCLGLSGAVSTAHAVSMEVIMNYFGDNVKENEVYKNTEKLIGRGYVGKCTPESSEVTREIPSHVNYYLQEKGLEYRDVNPDIFGER